MASRSKRARHVVDSDDEDEPEAIAQPATQSSSSATAEAAATFDDETAEDEKDAEDPETQPAPAKRPKPAIAAFFQPRKPKPANKPAAKKTGSVASFFTRVSKPAAAKTEEAPAAAAAAAAPAADAPASAEADEAAAHIASAASLRAGQYDPVQSVAGQWHKGEAVPYSALCAVLRRVEGISSRLEMQTVLCDFLRSIIALTPQDLLLTVYLCCNRLAPAYANLELGIGDSILIKAVSAATGRTAADVKAAARKSGDLGLVAEASRGKQSTLMKPKPLTVRGVFRAFKDIAEMSGNKSQDRKVSKIRTLLTAAGTDTPEARYIVRGLQGKLRIGMAESTVVVSLAHAVTITPPFHAEGALAAVEGEEEARIAIKAAVAAAKSKKGTSKRAAAAAAAAAAEVSAAAGDSGDEDDEDDEDDDDDDDGDEAAATAADDGVSPAAAASDSDWAGPVSRSTTEPLPNAVAPTEGGEAGTFASVLDARSPTGRYRGDEAVSAELARAVMMLKAVYSELPSYDVIIPRLLEGGVPRARACCSLTPGIPVAPMLAKPTKGVAEVLDRFESAVFTCEFKYDGERAQVHALPRGKGVRVFSRNSEETSAKYPDLAAAIPEAAKPETVSYILDGEVVAYDRDTGKLLPFQRLSTRARKDVDLASVKVQVIFQAFDLLYLNGRPLIRESLQERRRLLRESFVAVEHKFAFAEGIDAGGEGSDGLERIQEELERAVAENCEGLMVKTLVENASYEPSRRSFKWLKLKKDYMDGLTDTFDLVPIGAWHGKGKRTGRFGAFLLACYNPDTEEFESITKIGTGFSDENLEELAAFFRADERIVDCKPPMVRCNDDPRIRPEVWFKPCAVWEVRAADLSVSPVHVAAAGLIDATKGIALRFPRFQRVRDDKGPEQATNSEQIAEFYSKQPVVGGGTGAGAMDDDFCF